jgi:beta-phosphoglucomutase-like phosphatase (HAD superfamily)
MFDIDGTLVDSNGFDADLFCLAIGQELDIEVDRAWHSYRHVTDSGVLDEILDRCPTGFDRSSAHERVRRRFVTLVEDYLAAFADDIRPIAGAPDFVRRLRSKRDVTIAFATGGWRETAELKLHAVGIEFAGLPFASSSDARSRAHIMRLAERRATTTDGFSRRVYFGDAPWDLEASKELGYEFVAVGDRVPHRFQFPDLSDQDAILDALGV